MTNGNSAFEQDEKTYSPAVEARSVIDRPTAQATPYAPSYDTQVFMFISNALDELEPWGRNTKLRDRQLRNYITRENMFASSLGIVGSRNASFSWNIHGPSRTIRHLHDVLENANDGKGWEDLILKTSADLYTQDTGAFWEIVRTEDSPSAPLIGINNLDAARCWHTGDPATPVIYMDRQTRYHRLPWYSVISFAEMPCAVEGLNGMQYCALTRLLTAVQIRRNIVIRDYERTSGRNAKAVHLVKGVTSQQMHDAVEQAHLSADAAGLMRYMNPIFVGGMDPKAEVGHDTIELSAAPDDYDAEVFFKQYVAQIAMAFFTDYQEFSPLPGGNLGTSNQSQILHLKNHGKGPGLFRKLIMHAFNFRIFPRNCRFDYQDPDFEAEKTEAEVKKLRAQTRSIRIQSGEITPEAARQIANDNGDLPEYLMKMMGDIDVTENLAIEGDSSSASQLNDRAVRQGTPAPTVAPALINAQTGAATPRNE